MLKKLVKREGSLKLVNNGDMFNSLHLSKELFFNVFGTYIHDTSIRLDDNTRIDIVYSCDIKITVDENQKTLYLENVTVSGILDIEEVSSCEFNYFTDGKNDNATLDLNKEYCVEIIKPSIRKYHIMKNITPNEPSSEFYYWNGIPEARK